MKKLILKSRWKNFAVDVPGQPGSDHAIHAWAYHGQVNQCFYFKDGFLLSAKNKDYCLDVSDSAFKNGTSVGIWKKHGGINQQWLFEDGFLLCAGNQQFCLDIDIR